MKCIKLTKEDMHNLYDLLMMVNWMDYKNLKLNKMDNWLEKFYFKIEKQVIPELHTKKSQSASKTNNDKRN